MLVLLLVVLVTWFYSYLYGIETHSERPKTDLNQRRFTRTFMELKRRLELTIDLINYSFTRTFMELKQYQLDFGEIVLYGFTRTFMELKRRRRSERSVRRKFYSYLYGIETLQPETV